MDEFHYPGVFLDNTARLYARRFQEGSRALSLELTHCKTLVILAENSGIKQSRLAEICHLDPAQVTSALDLLEGGGAQISLKRHKTAWLRAGVVCES